MSELDWLMRVARPRTLAVVVAAIGLSAYGNLLLRYPRQWYRRLMYPPVKDLSGQGRDLEETLERRKSLEVQVRYQRLQAALDRAQAQGFDVTGLRREADVAMQLNSPAYRAQALLTLSRIELEIPRRKEAVAAASGDEAQVPADEPPVRASRGRRGR